jgi:Icc-related predicted phosphoesterase
MEGSNIKRENMRITENEKDVIVKKMKNNRISKIILIALMLCPGIIIGGAESPARAPELIFRTGDNKGEIRYAWLASGVSDVFSNCSLLVMQGIHSADEVKNNGSPIVSGIAAHSGTLKGEAGEWYSAVVSVESDSGRIYSEVRQAKAKRIDAGEYDLRFGVISDTHITGNLSHNPYPTVRRFEKALDWYNSEDIEVLAIVGDITDNGIQADWDTFRNSWMNHRGDLQLIAVMGNHDAFGNKNAAADRFEVAIGQRTNAHYVIGGYHFILLNAGAGDFSEQEPLGRAIANGRTTTPGSGALGDDIIPQSVKNWARTRIEMAKSQAPGKPIFVFLHWPIQNTTYKSDISYISSFGDNPLAGFFKDDPEVIVFSGHIHTPNSDPRAIWQGGFTSVNAVTLYYYSMGGGHLGNNENGVANSSNPKIAGLSGGLLGAGQGMIVSVKGSKVTIENFDFDFSEGHRPLDSVVQIPQTWEFDVSRPEDFPYTNAKRDLEKTAPVFDETKSANASLDGIIVNRITNTSVEIEFPQAMIPGPNLGNEMVHSYRFDFINQQTGAIDRSARQWSDFMLHPRLQRPTYTQLIGGLKPDTDYELRIYAYGSFQECSGQYLTCFFSTPD